MAYHQRSDITKRVLLLCVLFLAAWLGLERLHLLDRMMFPGPSEVSRTVGSMVRDGELQKHIALTLSRFLSGFLLGGVLGLFLGSLCGLSKKISYFLEPVVYLLYPLPKFALLPFFILLFGMGFMSQVFFIAMGVFFPLAINTMRGMESINAHFIEVAVHYGAKGWDLFKKVIWPGSLASIFSGLRVGVGLALTYTIVNEFLMGTTGIGAMMWMSLQTWRIDRLLIGIFLIAFLNLFFVFLLGVLENVLAPWQKA